MRKQPGAYGPPLNTPEVQAKVLKMWHQFLKKWEVLRGRDRISELMEVIDKM